MGEESGDDPRSPEAFIEAALIEAHHLANLTDLDAAELARRRLVGAQSAAGRNRTRDLLADACEYLQLASLQRRDAAAGFAKARRYARNAEFGLRHEGSTPVEKSVEELLRSDPGDRRSLAELRAEAAVGSYDRLRRETALDVAFAGIRSLATADGVDGDPPADEEAGATSGEPSADAQGESGANGDPGDGEGPTTSGEPATAEEPTTAEEALRAASLEVDIRRALQNAREARGESEFRFVSAEQLVGEEC